MDNEILQAIKAVSEKIDGVEKNLKFEINNLDAKIDRVDAKIDGVEKNLKSEISNLDAKIDRVDAKIDSVERNLKSEISNLDAKINKTNLILENEICPAIQLIAEGRKGDVENIKSIKNTLEEMASTVLALDVIHTMRKD